MKKLRMARPHSRALNVFEMASDYWSKSEEEVSTVGERWRGQLMSCSQPQYGNSDQIHSKMENVQRQKENIAKGVTSPWIQDLNDFPQSKLIWHQLMASL